MRATFYGITSYKTCIHIQPEHSFIHAVVEVIAQSAHFMYHIGK